jgi:hypothetical protein
MTVFIEDKGKCIYSNKKIIFVILSVMLCLSVNVFEKIILFYPL